jgi:molybdopterin molybdotransferase
MVAVQHALGRVAAEDVRALTAVPPFRNAQMDGFAARAAELAEGVVLPVDGVVPAGRAEPRALRPGSLIRIMTGAPLPEGADAVVPVEHTEPAGADVRVLVPRAPGDYVREAGSDVAEGDLVVRAGTRLAARHLAAVSATGVGRIPARRRLRVAVLTTGTEVIDPGAPLAFGEVYDANRIALTALVEEHGGQVVSSVRTSDDPDAFAAALDEAVGAADLVLTAGGISHGDYEVVRQVLEPRRADVTELAMQPGGPQATALLGGVPVICFPGNPVSAQVSFTVFVRPLLREAAGLSPLPAERLPLASAVRSPAGRRQWLRGAVENGRVSPVAGPGSHLVAAMARAGVLIDVPADVEDLPAGAVVAVLPL